MAQSGQEPIASLGYDGPLAPLSSPRQNLSDYFKEQVAVVTNPAIDREREAEHFSTRVYLGPRPALRGAARPAVELEVPLLTGGRREAKTTSATGTLGRESGTCTLEALLALFRRARPLPDPLLHPRARRNGRRRPWKGFGRGAVALFRGAAGCCCWTTAQPFPAPRHFLDPCLAVAVLHKALKRCHDARQDESLRRQTSLVVRSGALRNLHDLIFALGMGADALCPYLMWELAATEENGVANLLAVLAKGLEKVISTMGTHEIGGYGKYFASIGLCSHLAEIFETPNFCGSGRGGLTLARLEEENRAAACRGAQQQEAAGAGPVPPLLRASGRWSGRWPRWRRAMPTCPG